MIKLVLTFVVGFSFALFILNYTNLQVDVNVIKFAIPAMAILLVSFYFFRTKFSKRRLELLSYVLLFAFSFLNGLGVYADINAAIEEDINKIIPILLTVLGASVVVMSILGLGLLLKYGIQKLKKFKNQNWELSYLIIGSCIALYIVLGKIFI